MSEPDHYVVAGGGRVGRRVARELTNRGSTVTIVDPRPDAVDTLANHDRVEYLAGDAIRPSVLREAISDETSVVAGLTDQQETNFVVCMAAKRMRPEIRTVARIEDASDEFTEYVDDVFFPERASVKAAMNALTGSDVRTFEGVTGDLDVLDIRVDYESPAAGEVVSDVLPEGSVVVAETDGHVAVQHKTKLVAGRRYIVAADQDVVGEVTRAFQGSPAVSDGSDE